MLTISKVPNKGNKKGIKIDTRSLDTTIPKNWILRIQC